MDGVAIAHDWLLHVRGGERVLKEFCLCLEEVSVYTLFLRAKGLDAAIRRHAVYVSPLGWLPGVSRYYRYLLPWFPRGIEHFRIREAALLLSISHAVAKGIPHQRGIPHVCYCLTPMRYLWLERRLYFPGHGWSWKQKLLEAVAGRLRKWDLDSNNHVDFFVAISTTVQRRIERIYNRVSEVIYPPVDLDFFCPGNSARGEFYLVVSSLVPYKRIDLAVEAFNQNGRPLLVVGEGPQRRMLRRQARSNIRFLGWQPDREVRRLYRTARALIFAGEEDFGLVPVEAQACGCPVLAYGQGGATETVRDGETGLLWGEADPRSLCAAIRSFEQATFSEAQARQNAARFSRHRFREEWRRYFKKLGLDIKM